MKASTMQRVGAVSASEQKETLFERTEDDLGFGRAHVVSAAAEDEPSAHESVDARAFVWCAVLSAWPVPSTLCQLTESYR